MATRILNELVIDKIAAVDRPCQEHATVTIMKRDQSDEIKKAADDLNKVADLLAKQIYMSTTPSSAPAVDPEGTVAEDFELALSEVIASNLDWKLESAICDMLNPLIDALRKSIISICKDTSLGDSMRLLSIRNSVGQFLTALQSQYQTVVPQVAAVVTKREETQSELRKAQATLVKLQLDVLQAKVKKIGWTDEARAAALEARRHKMVAGKHERDMDAADMAGDEKASEAHAKAADQYDRAAHHFKTAANHHQNGKHELGDKFFERGLDASDKGSRVVARHGLKVYLKA